MNAILLILTCSGWAGPVEAAFQKGMTVSCQGYGRVWGTDAFAAELDRLKAIGVNSFAIHPYARINADGAVSWRQWEPGRPPAYIARPVREARRRGMTIMVKPHLAYWGSPFSWRGAIRFDDAVAKQRFYQTYTAWIVALAEAVRDADIFVVGAELDQKTGDEAQWRALVAQTRAVTNAKLTYAANWDSYERVPFWDALDYIGVQGYFPIAEAPAPDESLLRAGWARVLERLRQTHRRLGKPLLFTELGYNKSLKAAAEPWAYQQHHSEEAERLQAQCLAVGLDSLAEQRDWIHGVYLWKWFVGPAPRANFYLDTPELSGVIRKAWAP